MEAIITKSLSTNNEERKLASLQICQLMKLPSAFHEFWGVVVSSSNLDVRQAAAMYFYKMLLRKKKWHLLPDEVRQSIKVSVLERIHHEAEKKVKTVIVQAAGQIALNEPDGWPNLFQLIEENIAFEGMIEMRELGMFVISILTEHATSLFHLHVPALMNVFGSILTKPEYYGSTLAYLTVISMKNFLLCFPVKDKTVAQNFEYLIPSVMEVIKAQSTRNRPDRAIECLTFFEALLESYPRVVTANLKFIIEGLIRTAIFLNVDEISCKILDVICSIICQKTKKIAKDKDILQMLCETLYEIISSPKTIEEGKDHYDVFECNSTIINGAVDLLDTLANEVDPDILMKQMMPILDGAANNDNVFCKKAVYIILGVLVEKCRAQIKAAGLNQVVGFIRKGLTSDCYLSLNGALFTLWRYVENFKPDINVFLPDLIPLLLQLLQNLETNIKRIEGHLIPKMFCVLNECCEILESSLEPVLPIMVPTLLGVVNSPIKVHYRELAISVIGQAGAATKRGFREYFSAVLEVLRPFLADNLPDDQLPLQVQTFDTLGTLFKSLYVKGDEFQLVDDVVNVTLTITELKDCGELRSGLYSMLSDCSEFMKEKMENYIPRILKLMDISFKGTDSYKPEHSDETLAAHGMALDTDESDKKTAPIRDLKIVEEKEEALMALGNIAFNTGAPFQPYLKQCYLLCYTLSRHENNVIRAAAIEALANMYISIIRCSPDNRAGGFVDDKSALVTILNGVVSHDENVDVVYAVLEGYQKILKNIPQIANEVVEEGVMPSNPVTYGTLIAGVVKTVITDKCHCQKLKMREDDSDDDEDYDDDDDDDDDDEIEDNYSVEDLVIAAEELIPLLGDALPTDTFLVYFSSYQRHLLKLLEKHQANEIRESTSATLGLCAKYLGSHINVLAIEFAPIFPTLMKDANEIVRNNVAFCIAQMVIHGKDAMYSYFNDISAYLLNWLRTESCAMVLDNVCAAVASLIVVNKNLIPLNEIVPEYFRFLPLREDFDEYAVVFRSFVALFQNDDRFKDYLMKATEVVLVSSLNKQVQLDEAKQEASRLFEVLDKYYPNEKELIIRNLPENLRNHLAASL